MSSILLVALKSLLGYFFVLVLARLMGSKLISEMTFFNFVTGISLGTLMADLITSSRFTSTDAAVAMLVLTILTIGSGYLTLKNRKLHQLVNAEPLPLVSGGRILAENLKQARISLSQLQMLLREKEHLPQRSALTCSTSYCLKAYLRMTSPIQFSRTTT